MVTSVAMMNSLHVGCLLLVIALCHCSPHRDYDSWFEAEIVREPDMTYAVLHPDQTLEARCVAKGFPLPIVYFINEYIDFDYDPDDVKYTYRQINDTFMETRMRITDPAYAAYMPMLTCETENEVGFHDNIYMTITRL